MDEQNIKEILKRNGVSWARFADIAGVSRVTVYRIVNNKSSGNGATLKRLQSALARLERERSASTPPHGKAA